ncbi:MAG: chemotaxis response regulator protein-glutamate methylesterase [Planctomycetes bacterium]|nr:chemotaxis response regulator protein-glutamate methylesterase [Planctomycetota bacterium]
MTDQTRLLIVDDSALYRQTVSNVLRDANDVEVVGIAKDGVDALEKIEALDPDLLTLDVQMPDMDGIDVLREINRRQLRPGAIMLSSLTTEGAQVTTDALLEGAFDFILKPTGGDPALNRQRLRDALDEKIAAFRQGHRWRIARERRQTVDATEIASTETEVLTPGITCRAVVVGTSTGGPAALKVMLTALPADFPVPVLVVQHMPPRYTQSLARRLNEICALDVSEASDGMVVNPGTVVLAPGGRHMKLVAGQDTLRARVTDDPPEHGCRPSVDYLLRSAVEVFDGQALGVIMTGMGRDGLHGCELLKARGGRVYAEHEETCTVYGMPKAIVEHGLADRVVPLEGIARAMIRHVMRSRATGAKVPTP